MHICFFNPPGEYYSPVSGGTISIMIMEVARHLLARGHRVSIISACNEDPVYQVGTLKEVALPSGADLSLPRRWLSSLARRIHGWDRPCYGYHCRAYRSAIRHMRPDAVVLFNDFVSPVWLRYELPHARIALWLQKEMNTRQRNLRHLIAATNHFLTCSEYIRHWISTTHGIPLHQLTVAASGVNLDIFKPRTAALQPALPLRVLYLGDIAHNKGPDIVVDAIATLQKEGVEMQLSIARGHWMEGEDSFSRFLEEKMKAAQACYLGNVPRARVPELLRAHDVVCILSRSREPFSLLALEAMASGCAVVASDRGGLPEACGGAALLVDPDDFGAVQQSLRSLAQNPALLQRQKRRALERAQLAPWSACADVVEKTLTMA